MFPECPRARRGSLPLCLALMVATCGTGCGGGGSSPPPPPPPPPPISVSVSPATASPFLGATQQFTASVTNTTNTGVNWSVNGVAGGNAMVGTITAVGLYTAPQILPSPTSVVITATSQADSSKSASAMVTVTSDVAVSVAPAMPSVELGAMQQFTESVTGSGNPLRAVNWSVNGVAGGNAMVGTITATGLYTAPQILPSPTGVVITATSQADSSKNATTATSITSNFTISVAGPSAVTNGATAQYSAMLTPQAGSNPSPAVNWSVSGTGCFGSGCGTIDGIGFYTAPILAPSPPSVTITATSLADPAKTASLNVTINAVVTVFLAPSPASVALEATQQFTATVGGSANQNVIWDVDGIVGGNLTVGTINNPAVGPTSPTTYTAPVNMVAGRAVIVRATSQADPSKSASSVVSLFSTLAVTVSPGFSSRAVNRTQTFSVQVANTSNVEVEWRVENIPGGNTVLGQICVAGFSPCTPVIGPTNAPTVDYLAPPAVPTPSTVTVTAVSQADPQQLGSAQVNVLANVQVSVSPASLTLPPNSTQQFGATVTGSPNQNVAWSLSGPNCAGATCGDITAGGLYTAPGVTPSPNNTVTVTATSADGGVPGTATVTIASGAFISKLLPASITAGPANDFTLKVLGNNFVAGTGATASQIVFDGAGLVTSCASTTECTATLSAAAVSAPPDKPVQIRNPDTTTSNQVSLVVVPMVTTEDVISLLDAMPVVGKDIVVVEPTTAGSGSGSIPGTPMNIDAMGVATGNTCNVGGNSLVIQRPASGTSLVSICVAGDDLTTQHTYSITGPAPNDISVALANPQRFGFFIELSLMVPSTAQLGPRTLFVENANKEKAAASGGIEVKP